MKTARLQPPKYLVDQLMPSEQPEAEALRILDNLTTGLRHLFIICHVCNPPVPISWPPGMPLDLSFAQVGLRVIPFTFARDRPHWRIRFIALAGKCQTCRTFFWCRPPGYTRIYTDGAHVTRLK